MRIDPIVVEGLILGAILFAILMGTMYLMSLAHATNESPYRIGYFNGISDGKADARDWGDACDNTAWSSAELNSCIAGYDAGFPKGCIGVNSKHDPFAEYMTCFDYLNATRTQK
jgi:hypothetical protein